MSSDSFIRTSKDMTAPKSKCAAYVVRPDNATTNARRESLNVSYMMARTNRPAAILSVVAWVGLKLVVRTYGTHRSQRVIKC